MHCTSPGGRAAIACNEDGGQDEHFNGDCGRGGISATSTIQQDQIIIMDDILLIQSEYISKGSEEKMYDDPCDLIMMTDDWTSPVHIPRSRSWLCCGPVTGTVNQQDHCTDNIPTSRCEYSSLITAQPKSSETVNWVYIYPRVLFIFFFFTILVASCCIVSIKNRSIGIVSQTSNI